MKNNSDLEPQNSDASYHISVLLQESIQGLNIKPNGTYVDATFGGGGHSKAILNALGADGRLIAFDQDADAQKNALDDSRFTLIKANFEDMNRFLRLHEVNAVDGILADLGVSSWQFDTAERGFSFRFDGPLDMRMNQQGQVTAGEVLNEKSAEDLQLMFSLYGVVRNAKTLAQAIVEARLQRPFVTIADLKIVVNQCRMGEAHKYYAQVFQAIRIEVNNELGTLKKLLEQSAEVLNSGGRLAVITFHSLEDRLVKNYMKHGTFEDEPVKDFFGNFEKKFKLITKKPIEAGEKEKRENSRSRSAKLRVAEKI
ncbi:MAG: 16S rRNA (cytosine(1402)-N(4))-methyltransferase RsmH [Bacteroidetes bacterium]|nr:16S rRNA (cytosine(1402)-N(4))-methyltransferase RsmH [Bacteroidota bacterium]